MSALEQLGGITVLWPQMLWLLAPLPLLLAPYLWIAARRRRAHAELAGLSTPAAAGATGTRLRRALPPVLFFAALLALTGAVSRPHAVMTLPSMHKDVILAIDTSGSMRATDVKPDRLGAAQNAALTFMENQPRHTRIGIVSIAGSAALVQSPTDNRADLRQAIERLQLQQGTALGSGLYVALATLLPDAGISIERLVHGVSPGWFGLGRAGEARKPVPPGSNRAVAIVLLSDGENNHGPDPLEAAKLAAEHGVRIYTVGIGSPEGITLGFKGWSMRVRLDEDTLKNIATTTLGEYYAATTAGELSSIYEHLSARMVVERSHNVEVTAILIGLGALLLVISALSSILWFNRVL